MRGLCLAGGGIKAAAHIGALKALEEEGIQFDCVSGASSGSIVATMYALGYTSDEMWEMFKNYAKKIKYFEWKNIFFSEAIVSYHGFLYSCFIKHRYCIRFLLWFRHHCPRCHAAQRRGRWATQVYHGSASGTL